MAIANPAIATNLFGEQFTAYTDGDEVYIGSDLMSDVLAFVQPEEDSPIDLDCDDTGLLTITYLDTDGSRLTQSSCDDGETWA